MIDLATIGAGGGPIARYSPSGALTVGSIDGQTASAGAEPQIRGQLSSEGGLLALREIERLFFVLGIAVLEAWSDCRESHDRLYCWRAMAMNLGPWRDVTKIVMSILIRFAIALVPTIGAAFLGIRHCFRP